MYFVIVIRKTKVANARAKALIVRCSDGRVKFCPLDIFHKLVNTF